MARGVIGISVVLGAALLAYDAVLFSQPPPARTGMALRSPQIGPGAGFALAQQGGPGIAPTRARIIIGLSVGFVPEGLLRAEERTAQAQTVAAAQDAVAAVLTRFAARQVERFHVFPGMAAEVPLAAIPALTNHPDVAFVEPDALAAPTLAESAALVGAPAAWASGYSGAGQAVAILDTGVDRTHPFFGGRVVYEACFSTDGLGSSSVCSAETGPGTAGPCPLSACPHGTHVAGIAAGRSAAFSGIAPDASIIAIQVFSQFASCGCMLSYTSDQIRAMQRVYDLRNTFSIAAVNFSLGSTSVLTSQAACDSSYSGFRNAAATLRSAGIATVVASGNSGSPTGLSGPGCVSNVISVGSTTDGSFDAVPADQVSSFSNNAPFLSLLAPGHWITSSVPGGTYTTLAGTSMAAPHVTGAWAVLKARNPAASVSDVLSALTATGVPIQDPRSGVVRPRINVHAAVQALASVCTYAISPTAQFVSASATSGAVSVSTGAGCSWTASSPASFIAIADGAARAGPGAAAYTVAANPGTASRVGAIVIAGKSLTVTQAGANSPERIDLNRDGSIDLVWHHQGDGRIAGWLMSGSTLLDGVLTTPPQLADTGWKIVGAADLDLDGYSDLVWQHVGDGRVTAWLMQGLTLRRSEAFGIPRVADTAWRIAAVGDLDRDGRPDLVWQHAGGSLAWWKLNGLAVVAGEALSPSHVADARWRVVGAGDFDGDGQRDLLWQHQADGRIAVWIMAGPVMRRGLSTSPAQVPDVNWRIRAVADLNGDTRPDLVWQHVGDGRLAAWFMNGLTQIRGVELSPDRVSDTSWHIVGPR